MGMLEIIIIAHSRRHLPRRQRRAARASRSESSSVIPTSPASGPRRPAPPMNTKFEETACPSLLSKAPPAPRKPHSLQWSRESSLARPAYTKPSSISRASHSFKHFSHVSRVVASLNARFHRFCHCALKLERAGRRRLSNRRRADRCSRRRRRASFLAGCSADAPSPHTRRRRTTSAWSPSVDTQGTSREFPATDRSSAGRPCPGVPRVASRRHTRASANSGAPPSSPISSKCVRAAHASDSGPSSWSFCFFFFGVPLGSTLFYLSNSSYLRSN